LEAAEIHCVSVEDFEGADITGARAVKTVPHYPW
jgi:hypothetical protein